MKKWFFWITMCLVSILNGAAFFGASISALNRGLNGVDNQAALLFIPFLWIIAVFVLVVLNICTLIRGMNIKKEQIIHLLDVFHLSGLSKRAKISRAGFIIITCFLMLFGYSLFAAERMWSVAYALSGGILLLFLYTWKRAAVRRTNW